MCPYKTKINTIYIVILLAICSCNGGYELTELYEQKIDQSSKVIIQFTAFSTLNDGTIHAFALQNSSKTFQINELEPMPLRFLTQLPTTDTIYNIELLDGGHQIPQFESSKISKYKGTIIRTDFYKYSVGQSSNLSYTFNDFEERNDSLILKELEVDYFNLPINGKEMGFQKGNIKLEESKDEKGILQSIEIPAFLLPEYQQNSLDKLTILRNDSLKITGQVFFKFIPKSKMKIADFSNVGFYKKRFIDKKQKK